MLISVMSPLLLLLTGFSFARSPTQSFHLELKPTAATDRLTPEQSQALLNFLTAVEYRVPSKMAAAIGKTISVEFVSFDNLETLPDPCENKTGQAVIIGSDATGLSQLLLGSQIKIHALLISEILRGPSNATRYRCGHQDFYRLAMATLLHEIAHEYDSLQLRSPEEQALADRCRDITPSLDESNGDPRFVAFRAKCGRAIRNMRRTVSSRLEYQKVAEYENFESRNHLVKRSADAYEFSSIEEHFAVNFEFFILDPEYSCRKPTLNRFFRRTLDADPYPQSVCNKNESVEIYYQSIDPLTPSSARIVNLNTARIHSIHYLLADQGKELMSRWGHAMFRIVLCAPENTVECKTNPKNDVVVSYRANVQDIVIDQIKGLLGGYPSQLFLLDFQDVILEYTEGEDRDLISVPLNIPTQAFIDRTLESYWAYSGSYKFITNNCATETLNHLQAALSSTGDFNRNQLSVFTPIGLYDTLRAADLLDPDAVKILDRARNGFNAAKVEAKKRGYFFAAKGDRTTRAFNEIARTARYSGLKLTAKSDREFIDQTSSNLRRHYYLQLFPEKKIPAAFALLEHVAVLKTQKQLQEVLLKNADKIKQKHPELYERAKTLLSIEAHSSGPRQGYGVPAQEEIVTRVPSEQPQEDALASRNQRVSLLKEVEAAILQIDPKILELREELRRSQRNYLFYTKEVVAL